jgi:hypothetical protein
MVFFQLKPLKAGLNPICHLLELLGAHNILHLSKERGTAVAQWLRYCATNRKVAGSIPDGVIGIFH